MHHSRRKSFDWYGLKQHFSIRKYHFGAASVLLGMSIALGTGTQVVQAAETVTTPESTSVASSTSATESTTSETSTETATSSSSERTVEIGYIVKYATEDGTLVNASVETVSVTTTETIAKATVSVTAVVPEGYELASGQSATVSQEVTENGVNIVTVKVVKKAEEKAATSETTTTASTETATAKSTEASTTTTTTESLTSAPTTPEASKAQTAASTRTTPAQTATATQEPSQSTATTNTDTVAPTATVSIDTTAEADLAALNAIAEQKAVTDKTAQDFSAALGTLSSRSDRSATLPDTPTITNMDNGNGIQGYWSEYATVLNKEEAAEAARLTPAPQIFPDGYIGDPTTGRMTFLILELSNSMDATQPANDYNAGSFNRRTGLNYYIAFSVNRNSSDGTDTYAYLIDKTTNQIIDSKVLTTNGVGQEFDAILNATYIDPKSTGRFKFTMYVTELEMKNHKTGETAITRSLNVAAGVGDGGDMSIVFNAMGSDRGEYTTFTGPAPTFAPRQNTLYKVAGTAIRVEEELARYVQTSDLAGDNFTTSGEAVFADYELIEKPTIVSGTLASSYVIGGAEIRYNPSTKAQKGIITTKTDGTSRLITYAINPDHPDFLANYEKYKAMTRAEFVENAATILRLSERIDIIDAFAEQEKAINDDKSTTDDEKEAALSVLRKSTMAQLNTVNDDFLITFVTKPIEPGGLNTENHAITGEAGYSYTSTKYKFQRRVRNSEGRQVVEITDTIGYTLGPFSGEPKASLDPNSETSYMLADSDGNNINDADGRPINFSGARISLPNSNLVNRNDQVYYYAEKGGVKVFYVDEDGNEIKDENLVTNHADTGSDYNLDTTEIKPEKITYKGEVYYYKEIDLTTSNLVPPSANTDSEKRAIVKIDEVTGTIEQDTLKELTYVYEKAGNVNVNYVDTKGNAISSKVIDVENGKPGDTYSTTDQKRDKIETATGEVYYLVPKGTYDVGTVGDDGNLTAIGNNTATGIDAVSGDIESNVTKEITYVYQQAGNVIVHYVTEDDTELSGTTDTGATTAATVNDTTNGKPGERYDTKDLKPKTITTADGKTYALVEASTKGEETGTVEAGKTKEITYVYEEVKGDVIVHYVDTEGNPISGTTDEGKKTASTVTDTPESSTGTPYDTTDLRPNTITTADGKIYKRVPAATIGKEDGEVVEGTTEVTYVYELLQGDVIVHYVDTEGNTIADDVTDQVITDTGTDYDTKDNKPEKIVNDETGDVYYILPKDEVKAGDKETGKVVEGTTEVTYIYQKAGSVNVNYVDTEGNVLKDPVADVTDGKPGSGYDTVLDNKLASISVDGKLYRLVPAGTYNVGTVSDDNNLTAAGNGKATGIDATTGTVEAGVTKEITYVYQEVKGDVVVEYYDTEGNQIAKTVVDEDDKSVGTVYNTDEDNKPETITTEDGTVYYYKEVKDTSAPTTGKVAETTTTVQYVYEKAGSVNVNYVDTEGNPIQAPVADETNEKAGTEYATADNKPSTITTVDGKLYRLVPAGDYPVGTVSDDNNLTAAGNGKATGIDATTGTVEAGKTKEITYVYEEVKGNVVVNYITTDGTVIKQPVEDTPSTSTGTPYDTKDNKPTTITTEDGKTYRIVPVLTKGSETGKVVEGTTSITYVYEEVKGDVVVEYYDTEGNLISGLSDSGEAVDTKEVDTPSTSTGTAYNTDEDHKPNTITTADGTVYYYKEVKDTSASTTGKVVEGTTTVQYVYEKAGNVIVHYITEDGTVIKATVTDEENAKPGKSYDTTDNKPVEIVTEDGSRYVLIPSKTVGSETGTVEGGKTIEITYVYKKVANWIPQIPGVPEGQEPKVPYPFDPTNPDKPIDPTTPGTNGEVPSIPHVPGFTPVDPKTNEPLKPVDPTDPGKGYVPPTPDETGVDTPIPYVQNGNVVVNYVDENGNVLKTPVNDETDAPAGKSYDTTDNKPTEIVTEDGSRYVLIPSKTVGSETGTVEGGKTIEITYVYKKVANWIPQIPGVPEGQEPKVPYPFDPTNPDVPVTPTPDTVIPNVPGYTPVDPKTNEPLKPVDPTDPGKGYVPPTPEDSGVDTPVPYVQNGNVVVNYVTEDGTVIKTPVNDETDAPAGKSYDTTDNKPVEIVTEDGSRYVLIPSKTVGSETGTVEGGKTTEITYVYKKVANWIPQIPGVPAGEEPKVPYPFDPTTPDKPIDPTTPYPDGEVPSIPNVPGYTPVDPKTNEPLKPVDPTDPSKGYVPPTPDETGVDTPIPYVQNGNVVVNYVDENGNVLKTPVNDETDAPAGKSYDTTDNKPTEIVTEDGSRYVLIPSKTIGTENGTVEGGKTIEITYVYKKVANWIPQIPGVPEGQEPKVPYPFDPTNPDVPVTPTPDTVIPNVPGYTPVDPKTNEPLKPVDPTDPGKGYVPPTPDETGVDTPIPYVQTGNVVVNYVDENGNVLKTPVNDETNAKPDSPYDTTDNKPTEIVTEDGSRYVLIPSKTVGSETGTVEGGKTTEITYVYKKVANWVPQIPGVPEGQEPKVPYPFDPTNPDKPIDPTTPGTNGEVPSIPHVPGFTPVDPKTNEPLKPVDPNDPGKGYVPSTPDETGKDTPIPYVQNGNVVVNYVTEDGTVIKAPVQDETDAPAGKSYDTTDNKPNTITTEDGTTYELVRVEGSETGTVVGGKTTEVTYVYRKVETPAKKVVTNHVDEDGNPIAPQEEGTTPNKSIPGYEFTGKTVTDPDGNTTHIYRKVTKVVTNHVDEDGNPIAPQEEGTTPNKSIPGYEFTGKTVTDPDGNTTHIYRKVSKPVAPKPQAPVAPTTAKAGAAQLPNTGEASSSATVLGAGMLIAALALAGKRRRNED
ncbi:MucBP domain-containing protein [Streptococcus suis]|uniref:MucBP domain-containing protein n=1 Tax=Streptococcus suis TaxID=1307 RepID=UPI0021BC223D|nr:MucBP domain-containing protein [Streptococcus suis]